ncbi:unnamed protein product, partial [marine sediment metagenome]
ALANSCQDGGNFYFQGKTDFENNMPEKGDNSLI